METVDFIEASQAVGRFVKSEKPVNVYRAPGGELLRTVKPLGFIGKVSAVNSKGTWVYLTNESGAVFVTPDLFFKEAKTLTEAEKQQAIEAGFQAVLETNPVTSGQSVMYPAVRDAVKGVAETGQAALDITAFFGRNLKTILIVLVVIILLAVIAYSLSTIKSLKS